MAFLHTFSIVARDKNSGDLGVAVQTHWFAVGTLCPWVEAGIGVVATQSMVEVSYGPKSLELLRDGKTPREALDYLKSLDENSDQRQVAVVDNHGNTAVHTGSRCIREAGHYSGDGYSVQANMMASNTVWPAMADAYEHSSGNLSERMLTALKAGQTAGGDIRGMQSAAMLVVDSEKTDEPWKHVKTNLRVDDHPSPIKELERLLSIHTAYEHMNKGDELLSKGNMDTAENEYRKAFELSPNNEEIPFWHAVALTDADKMDAALPIFEKLFRKNPNWYELVLRLPESGLLKDDPVRLQKITEIMQSIRTKE